MDHRNPPSLSPSPAMPPPQRHPSDDDHLQQEHQLQPEPLKQKSEFENGIEGPSSSDDPKYLHAMDNFKAAVMNSSARPLTPGQILLIERRLNEFFPRFRPPDHLPYAEMISSAIKQLNVEGGSSEESISEFIKREHASLPWAHVTLLKHHLRRLCEIGEIVQTGNGCYLLNEKITNYNLTLQTFSPLRFSPGPNYSISDSSSYSLPSSPSSDSTSSSSSFSPRRRFPKRKKRRRKCTVRKKIYRGGRSHGDPKWDLQKRRCRRSRPEMDLEHDVKVKDKVLAIKTEDRPEVLDKKYIPKEETNEITEDQNEPNEMTAMEIHIERERSDKNEGSRIEELSLVAYTGPGEHSNTEHDKGNRNQNKLPSVHEDCQAAKTHNLEVKVKKRGRPLKERSQKEVALKRVKIPGRKRGRPPKTEKDSGRGTRLLDSEKVLVNNTGETQPGEHNYREHVEWNRPQREVHASNKGYHAAKEHNIAEVQVKKRGRPRKEWSEKKVAPKRAKVPGRKRGRPPKSEKDPGRERAQIPKSAEVLGKRRGRRPKRKQDLLVEDALVQGESQEKAHILTSMVQDFSTDCKVKATQQQRQPIEGILEGIRIWNQQYEYPDERSDVNQVEGITMTMTNINIQPQDSFLQCIHNEENEAVSGNHQKEKKQDFLVAEKSHQIEYNIEEVDGQKHTSELTEVFSEKDELEEAKDPKQEDQNCTEVMNKTELESNEENQSHEAVLEVINEENQFAQPTKIMLGQNESEGEAITKVQEERELQGHSNHEKQAAEGIIELDLSEKQQAGLRGEQNQLQKDDSKEETKHLGNEANVEKVEDAVIEDLDHGQAEVISDALTGANPPLQGCQTMCSWYEQNEVVSVHIQAEHNEDFEVGEESHVGDGVKVVGEQKCPSQESKVVIWKHDLPEVAEEDKLREGQEEVKLEKMDKEIVEVNEFGERIVVVDEEDLLCQLTDVTVDHNQSVHIMLTRNEEQEIYGTEGFTEKENEDIAIFGETEPFEKQQRNIQEEQNQQQGIENENEKLEEPNELTEKLKDKMVEVELGNEVCQSENQFEKTTEKSESNVDTLSSQCKDKVGDKAAVCELMTEYGEGKFLGNNEEQRKRSIPGSETSDTQGEQELIGSLGIEKHSGTQSYMELPDSLVKEEWAGENSQQALQQSWPLKTEPLGGTSSGESICSQDQHDEPRQLDDEENARTAAVQPSTMTAAESTLTTNQHEDERFLVTRSGHQMVCTDSTAFSSEEPSPSQCLQKSKQLGHERKLKTRAVQRPPALRRSMRINVRQTRQRASRRER